MSLATTIAQYRERANALWLARTEQERRFLAVGGAVVLLAILYLLLVDPAVEGRTQLRRQLPQLRQQAAELQALAQEAASLAHAPASQVAPLTRESVSSSLTGRGLNPQSLSVSGDYIKLQLNNVPFSGLTAWLDEQRRANRVLAQDVVVNALPTAGQVDASLTLRQNTGAPR
ncbi:type II secretion system protein M [Massilia forsythiae]|uniref:Type II secretion system protein M n=1 Tax=Massilia forsythiae TaxID=2728020 RepID=A0A7Z2ZS13_9BURK|nr:type II secretion system protein GspM [Massilia forsythiae]QJD99798.1 type II secretion system protein M [Massilia forsythiae]